MKFRKKPVEVEAIQYLGDSNLEECIEFGIPQGSIIGKIGVQGDNLIIFTLEGVMTAQSQDWIIRGVVGEYYPCKPDIFAQTYEPL